MLPNRKSCTEIRVSMRRYLAFHSLDLPGVPSNVFCEIYNLLGNLSCWHFHRTVQIGRAPHGMFIKKVFLFKINLATKFQKMRSTVKTIPKWTIISKLFRVKMCGYAYRCFRFRLFVYSVIRI